MENIVLFGLAQACLSVFEAIVGAGTQNVHIIRDFMLQFLLVCALFVSHKALTVSKESPSPSYTLGYRRINILAAFCNCIYI